MTPGGPGRRLVLAGALALMVSVGGTTSPHAAAAIDPCYGYDLCVHMKIAAAIAFTGDGNGLVTSTPPGIHCQFLGGAPATSSSTCDAYFHANFVTQITVHLDGVPDSGYSVGCMPDFSLRASCSYDVAFYSSMEDTQYLGFLHSPVVVQIGNAGKPGGFVYSTPKGIDCGEQYAGCSATWSYGTNVLLYAEGDNGGAFLSWTGACAGNNESCELVLQHDIQTTAIFGDPATPTPRPSVNASSGPSPKPTVAPGSTPRTTPPGATGGPQPSAADTPSGLVPPTNAPVLSPDVGGGSGSSAPATSDLTQGAQPEASGAGSAQPVAVASSTLDLTPIVIAVIAGCGLIAMGIVIAAALARRGRGAPRA